MSSLPFVRSCRFTIMFLLPVCPGINDAAPISFERKILPLLEHRCNDCHHPEDSQGGLDLTRVSTILRGGDEDGPSVIPGKPGESPLLLRITGELKPRMPKKEAALPQSEVALIRQWISEGAIDDTPKFSGEDLSYFEKEIRPILFARCFKCHAGEDAESGLQLSSRYGFLIGGDRGPAAIPGKPEHSLLIKAVRHDGDLKMPKGGDPLEPAQIAALEEWIRRGMPWPDNQKVLTREKIFSISEADRNHWAFRPLPNEAFSIDETLAKHQLKQGLESYESADRYRLLRRVSFDLIGYPPTPREIDAFVSDSSEHAFAKVVDRLLASELFGKRWGRHWLDYTRNGANGQQNRGPEMSPDRYAEWVTDCFNRDIPYDWFARVHLAGDLMPDRDGNEYSIDQALAAAVPLNGARTFQNAATETFVLMDKLDEGVEFLGRSLMGISLECARCHDHKFDPISQKDYYALLGFFQSSWFGPVPKVTKTPAEAFAAVEKERDLLRERAHFEGLIRVEATKISVRGGELRKKWKAGRQDYLAPWDKRLMELEVAIFKAEADTATREGNSRLASDINLAIKERETKLKDFTPRFFDVRSLKEIGYQINGHKTQAGLIDRAKKQGLTAEAKELKDWAERFEAERKEWWERHRFGSYRKGDPAIPQLNRWDDEVHRIDDQLEALRKDRVVARCEGGLRRAEDLEPFAAAAQADNRQFYADLVPAFFGDARLLDRGDVLEPRELIPRGFPVFFGGGTPAVSEKSSGRRELANWLTRPESIQSALVARAAANRAWQNLFGEALCRSPKELGRLGEAPEMPDLIDAIAVRFVRNGWSMKSMIREIVLSKAYQQTSRSASATDPHNRYFTRQNVRRLETEPIVNSMAFLSHGDRDRTSLLGKAHYESHFDPPTTDDIIDRRVASISPTQALFLMNNPTSTRQVAGNIVKRLGLSQENPVDNLDEIYINVLQRLPTQREIEFAKSFGDRGNSTTDFIQLFLCSNEMVYIE